MKKLLLIAALSILPIVAFANSVNDRSDAMALKVLHAERVGDITPPQAHKLMHQLDEVNLDNAEYTADYQPLTPSAEDRLMSRLDIIQSNFNVYSGHYNLIPGYSSY